MYKFVPALLFTAVVFTSAEALAWPTSTVAGTGQVTGQVQGYAWKDQGGGVWTKWNSVAYRDDVGADLKVARRSASSASPAWSAWTIETVDNSAHDVGSSVSIALDANGVEYISYVDVTSNNLKVAKRVGGGAGNCFAGSQWDCATLVFGTVGSGTSIGLTLDAATQQYTTHIAYTRFDPGEGITDLWYARKIGAASWTTAWIRETNAIWLSSEAMAFSGATPRIVYGEAGFGIRYSKFQGPAQGNWVTSTIDATGGGLASMVIKSTEHYIVYNSGSGLKYATWNPFSGAWVTEIIDTSTSSHSLAVSDGFVPHVTYKKNNVAKRAKRPSSTWVIDTADSTYNTGYGPSIEIDTQPAVDTAIVSHTNGFGTLRIAAE